MSHESEFKGDQHTTVIGKWMIIALWILFLGFGTFFAQKWLDKRSLGQEPSTFRDSTGRNSVTLKADRLGHYVVSGSINNQQVTFLVDTGASNVSIPEATAIQLGLVGNDVYLAETANGTIEVQSTTLNRLSIGNIHMQNVPASINPSMEGNVALLGMSMLRHFELRQKNGELTIAEP